MSVRYALDTSARTITADGHLQIARTRISKATVNPYYGSDIPGCDELGLDPTRIYYLLRAPEELAAGASTFAEKPLMITHQPISAEDHPREITVGTTGSIVDFEDPYLYTSLSVWDQEGIDGIDDFSRRELSSAYRYLPLMTPGVFRGMRYDGVMTNIIGNHVALVASGRAGSDVFAADSKLKPEKKKPMATRKGNALRLALIGFAPKLAQDSSLPGLVADAGKKTFNRKTAVAKILAMDDGGDIDKDKLMDIVDAILDDDPAEDAEAETEEEKKKRLAKEEDEKKAKDKDEDKNKKAMDAAITTIHARLSEAAEARRIVAPFVGDVVAQDSAADIYGFALDHLKVNHEGVTDPKALRAILEASQINRSVAPVAVAMDSASMTTMFPNAGRFNA